MKGYECWLLTAFVTLVIFMCLPLACTGNPFPKNRGYKNEGNSGRKVRGRNGRGPKGALSCTSAPTFGAELESSDGLSGSFYIRNTCKKGGFLTVVRSKVLLQTSGLNISHPDAEFVKESCSFSSDSFLSSPVVRYLHKVSQKYICFTKTGKVRTVNARRVEKKGIMCAFKENLIQYGYSLAANLASRLNSSTHHTIQSLHKSGWMLGFSTKKGIRIPDREPHRGSLPRRGSNSSRSSGKCGFQFHSGTHGMSLTDIRHQGLFEAIDQQDSDIFSSKVTGAVSKVDEERLDVFIPLLSKVEREFLTQQRQLKYKSDKMMKVRHPSRKKVRPSRRTKNLRKKKYGRNKSVIRRTR